MFSRRTDWDLGENPLSLELEKLRAQGVLLFDLTESNPTKAGLSYPPEALLRPLADEANLLYVPDPRGMPHARSAVAGYYAQKGVQVAPENIFLTSSSSEAYGFLFRLLMDPGDRVLLPAPSYPLFSYLAGLNDVEPAYYRLFYDDGSWRIDLDTLEESIDRGAKAVVLVSPNNPTGSCVKLDEISRLNALCAEYGLAIISDEVFADYIFDEKKTDYRSLAANEGALSFALGGVSKSLALPQMKLGWIAVNGPPKQVQGALGRLEVIMDTYLSVNTPAQNALGAWLSAGAAVREQVMARVRANYGILHSLAGRAVEVLPVEGGWYAVIRAQLGMPEDEWALELLRDAQVLVHPGFFFDFADDGVLVVSLLPPEDVFREGIGRLLGAIEKS